VTLRAAGFLLLAVSLPFALRPNVLGLAGMLAGGVMLLFSTHNREGHNE
jgi:hypothetical protein